MATDTARTTEKSYWGKIRGRNMGGGRIFYVGGNVGAKPRAK